MTPADAAELLAIAAAFDRRTVGDFEARAWAKALHGLRPADCAQAIQEHYTDSTEWLMPGHVRAGVRRIRNERIRSVPSSALEPADVNPADVEAYQAARLALVHRIADGEPVRAEPVLPRRDVVELIEDTARRMPKMPGSEAAS